jgi:hypothetical protein
MKVIAALAIVLAIISGGNAVYWATGSPALWRNAVAGLDDNTGGNDFWLND